MGDAYHATSRHVPLQHIQVAALSSRCTVCSSHSPGKKVADQRRILPSETATVMAEAPLVGSMTTMKVVLSSLPLKEVICSRTANVKACVSLCSYLQHTD